MKGLCLKLKSNYTFRRDSSVTARFLQLSKIGVFSTTSLIKYKRKTIWNVRVVPYSNIHATLMVTVNYIVTGVLESKYFIKYELKLFKKLWKI